ncbi:PLP-dependent aminotransferase family protein [Rhodobacteraceae bacterium HSP-20]|uniref:PLP-dependent aminotransferase family protein n=1 Tax=Paragemmobacter amnigenus TaxID=2852097 RepID=A0ABS6IXR2_9RHOB|nr:PLP-dependent aminotransferase family protein [Rhodobacter amnigenus]MBV4387521.1 PLP-dependent aminotransferase family protein [Rhodobacter amnigenus]
MADTIWKPDLAAYPGPKYLALSRALREAIRSGELAEGEQLPTVRDLAWVLGVTPGTVSRAYALATQEGLLAATVGRGTFVAARAPKLGPTQPLLIERDPEYVRGRIDLRAPRLPDVGQIPAFRSAMQAISARLDEDWIDYTTQRSEAPLREAVCGWLSDRALGSFGPEDIALTAGGQNAINLILLCCLRGDRPVVLTEELAYPGFRHAARLARAEVVGVETDAEGMIPEALEAACRRHGAQVLCLTTEAQNPTTARMGMERRQRIAAIARHFDLQVIEDDCYTLSESTWPSLRALAPERVWHVGSLSKTISAALRFGFIVCPAGMGETGRLTAQHAFFALPRPVSDLCLHLFQSGAAVDIRRRVGEELAGRIKVMVNTIGRFDLAWQPGLRFAFLRLPLGWRASTFTRMAEAEGVLVRSADEYALSHGRAPQAVRLALAGHVSDADFAGAMDRLAGLLSRPPYDPPAV